MKSAELKPYETDASRMVGDSSGVILPENVEEVKQAVRANQSLVIRGAGTGFSGGCVPLQGEVVLDVSKIDFIEHLDKERKTVEVGAGAVLHDLQEYLKPHRLCFPIDIVSRKIATLGGMIASNAYSARNKDYGRVSQWIHWIDVVDASGEVQRKGVTQMSDYCGLEGTTGVIVRACLKLMPLRRGRSASVIEVGSLDEAISIARNMKRDSNVSMVEFFDAITSNWMGLKEGYHLVLEYEDDTGALKKEAYEKTMKAIDEVYLEAIKRDYLRVEDPKVITDRFDKIALWLDEHQIPFISHMSHGIIVCFFKSNQELYVSELMKKIRRMGGQVSASFGIGALKKEFLDASDKKILHNIKKRCDVHDKFNPGKLL